MRELADLCTDTITPSAGWNNAGAFLVVGPVTAPPPIIPTPGFSLELNGTTAFAEAPHAGELNPTDDWTIEAWFKDEHPSYDHPRARILSKGDTAGPEVPYFVAIESDELIAGLRTQGTPQLVRFNLKINKVAVGSWHHVAATLQTSTHELSLYLDGVRVARATVPTHSRGNSLPLSIGRSGPVSGHYWRGNIDDVRIWNVARTADEIQAHLLPELPGAPTGLVGNWRFDEGIGPVAADSAGPPQNAALQGGAGFSTDTPSPTPPAPPGVNIGGATCVEGSHCVFTVSRSGGTGTANVSYKTENGTATGGNSCTGPGIDFVSAAGSVSIAPESTAAIAVATCVDSTFDPNEAFNLVLSNTTQGTIFDRSGLGTITEGTCIAFDTSGNCIAFAPPPGTICIQFNALGQCVQVGPAPPGTCLLRDAFGNCIDFGLPPSICPAGYFWNGVQCVFIGTAPGQIAFTNGSTNVSCARSSTCAFTIQQAGGDTAATVSYFVSSGTAITGSSCGGGVDVAPTSGTVFVAPDSTAVIVISTCAGSANAANETFTVNLTSTTAGVIASPSSATGTMATV